KNTTTSRPQSMNKLKVKVPISLNPQRGKANKAIENGDNHEALKYLNDLIANYPDNYSARCDRAEIYQRLRRYDDAINDLNLALNKKQSKLAINKKQSKSRGYYIRGLIYKDTNQWGLAKNDLTIALKKDINDPRALESLKVCAQINLDENDFDQALYHLSKLLD